MTQVLSISATTAGYVSDTFKQAQTKTNNFNPLAEAITEWHAKAVADGDVADRSLLELVHPPSLALTFLTASSHKNPQLTAEQATEEYKANSK
jgi:hypothetical protein